MNKNKTALFLLVMLVIFVSAVLPKWSHAQAPTAPNTQQQGTFDLITPTPTVTPIALPTNTPPPGSTSTPTPLPAAPVGPGPLPTGGAAGPNDPFYCIDDEDPDGCDDQTAFHVPKGTGGVPGQGSCGTVMQWSHKLVSSLPDPQQFMKAMRNSLDPAVSNPACNYTTGPYSAPNYVSTYFVIDAYNLAGYHELSRDNPGHVRGSDMLAWWKSNPPGYTFLDYSITALENHANGTRNLTGCVVFINTPSGVHVGIFNVLQLVNTHGDGVLSILQSGARFILDRFPVVGWDVKNTPLHQTVISGVAGFGCHQ